MSDIGIQVPWWFGAVTILAATFWPLTVAVAGAGIWLFAARRSRIARIVAIVAGAAWVLSASIQLYAFADGTRAQAAGAAYDRAHRRTLASDTTIDGMQLPAGTVVVTGERDRIASLELPGPAVLFGVPLAGTVELRDGKLEGSQTLARDATIDGLPCAAVDGASFEGGRLTDCRLARPATIRGVPCRGYVTVHADFLGCELARSYRRYGTAWHAGTDVRGGGNEATFTIGSHGPGPLLYGSHLPAGTMVVYRNAEVALISFAGPFRYRGCTLAQIERRGGTVQATVQGACALPALANGRVAVPGLTLRSSTPRGQPGSGA